MIHYEDEHFLLAPSDLTRHLPEFHDVESADVDTRVDVEGWLERHGIPSANDPRGPETDDFDENRSIDVLHMYHTIVHDADEGTLHCDECRDLARLFAREEATT
jgi:hypothetical protein